MLKQVLRQGLQFFARTAVFLLLGCPAVHSGPRPQTRLPTRQGILTLEADQQRQVGKIFYADGNVDILYEDARLRADHVEFNDETKVAVARGHVQFDRDTQHLEADRGTYNLRTATGTFEHVRGTVKAERRPNPSLLVSPNPLYFEADEVERVDERTYKVRHAWLTVCDPGKPKWKFYAPRATIYIQRAVHMENASFRLFSVPIVYMPYATAPAGSKLRQSGFLLPEVGQSTLKGFILGDSYYWAPSDWFDLTAGAMLLSRRGWSQTTSLRARPSENVKIDVSYFGVRDRGFTEGGVLFKQGGHEAHIGLDTFLPNGWRAVADLNQLSSLTFRLAWANTFSQAVNSEVFNTVFLSNSFHGFNLSFAALGYKNFFNAENVVTGTPETAVVLRTAPEARFGSLPQAPWQRWPFYFSFQVFADALHRSQPAQGSEPAFDTPSAVQRFEIAPTLTMPLRWGPWIGVTPTFTFRSTRYGAQLLPNETFGPSLVRTTEEFSVDIRPPSFARVWGSGDTKWKHDIEPDIVYSYVTGINQFGRFIRFDEDETLTDTNEVEYAFMQRLYRRSSDDGAEEFLSWRVAQKYFFDPTFGGALAPGQRNVFQTLDSLTPFAFADQPRHFSPIVSDLRITPGRRYDAQFRVDYDPQRGQVTAVGTLLKLKPYRQVYLTLAHFSTTNLPPEILTPTSSGTSTFQPRSNQVRALLGYGDLNRRGWNSTVGFSYDVTQRFFQTQIVQVSYNGSCCGIGLEYRRFSLGNVRVENQFLVRLLIANIGSVGNLRRQEQVF